MKENNKFSLSAFFCSLGSKSKIFMLFLLGAPFLLVQIFTLKVCANSAVVPVVPEGLTTSGIGSSGVVPGDPSLMYYTLLIALGMKADEVYQVNKADIIDSVTEALNEYDSVNDPSLGDDLETYLEWYDNAKSQNGYINELSVPRELWDRVNKASSSGLNLKIKNGTTINLSAEQFYQTFCISNMSFSSVEDHYSEPLVLLFLGEGSSAYRNFYCNCLPNLVHQNGHYYLQLSDDSLSGVDCFISNATVSSDVPIESQYIRSVGSNYNTITIDGHKYIDIINDSFPTTIKYVIGAEMPSSTTKHVGVARPFITSKANGSYDVLSKSGVINDQTGDLEGDVTMSILSYDKIKDIASDYEDSATDIPVFFPDSRLVPIDIENPDAIPDSVGIPGDTPQEIVDSLADTFDPSPAEPIVIEPFNYIDNWDPVIPVTAESPLVGLPFVMNWVAEQMQITMFLSQFSNTWLVLSTLAVASCLVGLVRIWR